MNISEIEYNLILDGFAVWISVPSALGFEKGQFILVRNQDNLEEFVLVQIVDQIFDKIKIKAYSP